MFRFVPLIQQTAFLLFLQINPTLSLCSPFICRTVFLDSKVMYANGRHLCFHFIFLFSLYHVSLPLGEHFLVSLSPDSFCRYSMCIRLNISITHTKAHSLWNKFLRYWKILFNIDNDSNFLFTMFFFRLVFTLLTLRSCATHTRTISFPFALLVLLVSIAFPSK